ncbi:MAG: phosphatase PAP2 family protein [Patescibacteria group bacterium]
MNNLFIFGATYVIILSPIVALCFLWKLPHERRKGFVIVGLISAAVSYAIAKAVSHLYVDPRPFVVTHVAPLIPHAADNGFPSDHALLVGVVASVVSLYDRRFGAVLWFIAFLVGISRVIVGVHHLVDILGSFLIASVSSYVVYRMWQRRTSEAAGTIER